VTDDLVAFLRGRADEDEAWADQLHDMRSCARYEDVWPQGCTCDVPGWVLAEVQAKRSIIDRYAFVTSHGPAVDHTRAMDMTTGAAAALRDVLRFLALAYASHPDYRPEWEPNEGDSTS
jgi:hypothetical protein